MAESDSPEEHDLAALGLDPNLSTHLCRCGAQCLDLGKETGDRYRQSRRWFRCTKCNEQHSEVLSKI
jgi:hypothetical protein